MEGRRNKGIMSRLFHVSRSQDADALIEEGIQLVSLLPDANGSVETDTLLSDSGRFLVDYGSFTVARLRKELKRRGLSQKGLKRELVRHYGLHTGMLLTHVMALTIMPV